MVRNRVDRTREKRTIAYFDYTLMAVLIFLIGFGLLMLYSTSSYSATVKFHNGMFYLKNQLRAYVISFGIMLIVYVFDYHIYARLSKLAFWLSMVVMTLVFVPGIGIEAYGARRWIKIPIFGQMQPSECMKIAIVIFIPTLICRIGEKLNKKEGAICILIWGGIAAAGVLFLTDNLSTAVIVMGMVFTMFFVAHRKTKIFLVIGGAMISAFFLGAQFLGKIMEESSDFRIRRILAWVNPEMYTGEGSYQSMQALYAIGAGGFFGKGLGNSTQKFFIPEAQNDMILSIICEELGIFGLLIVLLLFSILLYRIAFVAQNAPDLYGSLIATGVFAHIAIQVVLNVGVVTNLLPTTGVTLPFVSYGGTATVFLMIEMGLVLNISSKIKVEV
ncbi:FtsW/RodA/SpoVE family cell cycle protein [Faecalimonas sp.]